MRLHQPRDRQQVEADGQGAAADRAAARPLQELLHRAAAGVVAGGAENSLQASRQVGVFV